MTDQVRDLSETVAAVLAGSLDRELREHGIRVTAICPAAVSTEFAIGAGRNEGDA
jgi:short-subunit dehydrogenase